MSTHSLDGREWAKLSDLKPGDYLEADGDFTCIANGKFVEVIDGTNFLAKFLNWWNGDKPSKYHFYVHCDDGRHYLDGQLSDKDHDHLVGLWKVT